MALQAGIVGLPNVGKSTLFNALTAGSAHASNYPFATIDPNIGVVPVPDGRLAALARTVETQAVIPATLEVVDIAGLVRGASEGEGLGNQFLNHIRSVDAILHVVRCFEDPDIVHVSGDVDPARDIDVVELELVLSDLAILERRLERLERAIKTGDKGTVDARDVTARLVSGLSEGVTVRAMMLSPWERATLADIQLVTTHPVLYVCNVDEGSLGGNRFTREVEQIARKSDAGMIVICAEIESEIARLDDADREAFLAELGLEEPGLLRLVREAYRLLDFETFFTVGPKEIRAWTVPGGTRAQQAAGSIHTDMARGFIRAEVYSVDELLGYGSEAALRAAGKIRAEGKDYLIRDGDVVFFRFNV